MLRRETVGEHTFNVLRIWDQLKMPMVPLVFRQILWHDMGEILTGDLPFPIKRDNPEIKKRVDLLQDQLINTVAGSVPNLSLADKWRLKVCDLLDMLECGCQEMTMGNKYGIPIVHGTYSDIMALSQKLPIQVDRSECARVVAYAEKLMRDGVV